jgi:hypothetical protein
MRTLMSAFIILILALVSSVVGTLISLALAVSIILFPMVLAIRVVQLILKPLVLLIEMMLVQTERIFVKAYDAVFHGHGHGVPAH